MAKRYCAFDRNRPLTNICGLLGGHEHGHIRITYVCLLLDRKEQRRTRITNVSCLLDSHQHGCIRITEIGRWSDFMNAACIPSTGITIGVHKRCYREHEQYAYNISCLSNHGKLPLLGFIPAEYIKMVAPERNTL